MQICYRKIPHIIRFTNFQAKRFLLQYIRYDLSSAKKNKQKAAKQSNSKANASAKRINIQVQLLTKQKLQAKRQAQKQECNYLSPEDQQIFKHNKNLLLISNKFLQEKYARINILTFPLPILSWIIVKYAILGAAGNSIDALAISLLWIGLFKWFKWFIEKQIRYSIRIITKIQVISNDIFVIQYQNQLNDAQKIVQSFRVIWNVSQQDILFDKHWMFLYKSLLKFKMFRKNKIPFQKDPGIWCIIDQKSFWVSSTAKINPKLKHLLLQYTPSQKNFFQQQSSQQKTVKQTFQKNSKDDSINEQKKSNSKQKLQYLIQNQDSKIQNK